MQSELAEADRAPNMNSDVKHHDDQSRMVAPECRTVVAIVLRFRGRIGLFRRSSFVGHDRGLWHCITGYVEPGVHPSEQALVEIFEETGLMAADLTCFREGSMLELLDVSGKTWKVHTFHGETIKRQLTLNWENDRHRWVTPHE